MTTAIRYPIGIQSFEKIRKGHFLYVDKTDIVYRLVKNNYIFLSRPRQFGKSLLLSTIEAYFRGRRELFRGLAMEQLETDWKAYPVFRLDLSGRSYDTLDDVKQSISFSLEQWEADYGLEPRNLDTSERFYRLIRRANETTVRKIVILVDEYDKPIIDVKEDREKSDSISKYLRGFYSVIKKADEFIKFAMITGESKMASQSIFTNLNNLDDITFSQEYNTVCGFTEKELYQYFEPSIKDFARINSISRQEAWNQIITQYGAYHFSHDCEDLYNPLSVISAFSKNVISDYWYRSDSSNHLPKLLRDLCIPLDRITTPLRRETDLTTRNDNTKDIVPYLFQTGYLTLQGWDVRQRKHILGFPNLEVFSGFWHSLAREYFPITLYSDGFDLYPFLDELEYGKADSFMERLKALIASVTCEYVIDRKIYLQNILTILCKTLSLELETEIHYLTNYCYITIKCSDCLYLFVFHFKRPPLPVLKDIEKKEHLAQNTTSTCPTIFIEANLNTDVPALSDWEVLSSGVNPLDSFDNPQLI